MEINTAVTALAALAHHSRLAIFRLLVQAGSAGMAAGQISTATGIAPSSLSFHLKELSHAGLIYADRERDKSPALNEINRPHSSFTM